MSLTIVSPMLFLIKRTAKHIFQTPITLTLFVVLMATVMWGYSVIDAADWDFFPSSSLAFLFTYYYNSQIASSVVKDSLPVADERITKWVKGQTFSFMFAWFLMLVVIDLVFVNRLQLDPNYVYVKNTGTQFLMLSFIFSFIKTANWFVFFDVFNDSRIASAAMLKMGIVMNSQDLGTSFIENKDNKKHIKQLLRFVAIHYCSIYVRYCKLLYHCIENHDGIGCFEWWTISGANRRAKRTYDTSCARCGLIIAQFQNFKND